MTEVDKRAFVAALYPSRRWKQKVERMSDAQVTAIFLKNEQDTAPKPDKPKKEDDNDIPF